ncbi:recombinase A [Spiroplasma sp. NBRC 100390]|uniref:recombinase RecA n=1 Tax=unclassified Spiroplasma TaxID=2637901 RepID=UPI0008927E11|nr:MULTISPECIES: recombinase RecA [unclassified Spiroplasma]AOX43867.1 recombinase A [Spiroplasma sp. TU-14]APE13337.1 recombinase A [Spiroplasma sp. NBRC 100390]
MEKDNKTNSDNIKTIDEDEILKNVMKEIEKAYGKGAIMKLGDKSNLTIEAISTGSLLLDEAIGIGGYPKGRIIEIFGPESSGKTTLSLHAIAETQKRGGRGAFIDAEHALDPNYARKLGVNIDELIIAQPDSGEQALDILETLVKSNAIDLVVIDSVAALVPKVELDGEMSDVTIGAQARLMSKALRKLNGAINKTNSIVIFINQIREKVGVFFGNPETTAGGRALRFYASVRLDVRRTETVTTAGIATANKVKIKVVKNKVSPPFKTAIVDINYNEGIDKYYELIDLAVKYDILEKTGVWYAYQNDKLGQGRERVKEYLKMNPPVFEEIYHQIITNFKINS